MTNHLHVLKGCSPMPLANYLKALGVLRLVGERADPHARGWWQEEAFCLLTKLSQEELEAFFLERYEPTPIFNPWGGRSGYYGGSSEKTARVALLAIEESITNRLSNFRTAIALIRSVIQEGGGAKPGSEESKSAMISRIRMRLRGSGLEWLDTVIADLGDSFRGPAILGTGGNEGSGSYTAAFLAAVVECVVRQSWNSAISASLWSDGSDRYAWDGSFQPPTGGVQKKPKKEKVGQPFRQYLPGGTGSPWDLLLSFEGAILVQSGVARRSSRDQHRFLSSPFYFSPLGMGAGSSSEIDEFVLNKGRKNPGRGEQWFPLWSTPSTYDEIQRLFREGRCSAGRRAARNPLDAARAICGLGASRGITSFIRYGYLQRDNLATHLAVPLGRIEVRENSTSRLVDDLAGWLDYVHRLARKKNAPTRLNIGHRRLAAAVFAALTHDYTPDRWQAILLAAAEVEALQAGGTAIEAGPIPPLRPEWVAAVADGSAELRLGLALGSAAAGYADGRPVDPVRHHWLPLKTGVRRFDTREGRLVNDPRVVMTGRDPLGDLVAVVERRLIEAAQHGRRRSRLMAAPGCGAHLGDLAAFLCGSVQLYKLFGLARAFMAIRWEEWSGDHALAAPTSDEVPDEAWLAARLCVLPWALDATKDIPADGRIVRLLSTGDAVRAVELVSQRLRAASLRPPFAVAVTDPTTARRWAAALVFPIHRGVAQRIATILDPSLKKGGTYA
jgi:CRISPR-associated protein Csx17